MHPKFVMCDSVRCPSRKGCYRNPASGTEPMHSQPFEQFDDFLNIDFDPPVELLSCSDFLPVLQADGKVQFPIRREFTLNPIRRLTGSWAWIRRSDSSNGNPPYNEQDWLDEPITQRIPTRQDLGPEEATKRIEAGWEVAGYYLSEREARLAAYQRRADWLKEHPQQPLDVDKSYALPQSKIDPDSDDPMRLALIAERDQERDEQWEYSSLRLSRDPEDQARAAELKKRIAKHKY